MQGLMLHCLHLAWLLSVVLTPIKTQTVLPPSVTVKKLEYPESRNITLSCNISNILARVTHVDWLHKKQIIKTEPGAALDTVHNNDGTVNQWSHLVVTDELRSDLSNLACSVYILGLVIRQPYVPGGISDNTPSASKTSSKTTVVILAVFLTLALLALIVLGLIFYMLWIRRYQKADKQKNVLKPHHNGLPSRAEINGDCETDSRYSSDPTGRTRPAIPGLMSGSQQPVPLHPDEPTYHELQVCGNDDVDMSPGPDPLDGLHRIQIPDEYLDMTQVSATNDDPAPYYLNYSLASNGSRPSGDLHAESAGAHSPPVVRGSRPSSGLDTEVSVMNTTLPGNSNSRPSSDLDIQVSPKHNSLANRSSRSSSGLDVEVSAKHNSFKEPVSSVYPSYLPMAGSLDRGARNIDLHTEVKPGNKDMNVPAYLNLQTNNPSASQMDYTSPSDDMNNIIEAPVSLPCSPNSVEDYYFTPYSDQQTKGIEPHLRDSATTGVVENDDVRPEGLADFSDKEGMCPLPGGPEKLYKDEDDARVCLPHIASSTGTDCPKLAPVNSTCMVDKLKNVNPTTDDISRAQLPVSQGDEEMKSETNSNLETHHPDDNDQPGSYSMKNHKHLSWDGLENKRPEIPNLSTCECIQDPMEATIPVLSPHCTSPESHVHIVPNLMREYNTYLPLGGTTSLSNRTISPLDGTTSLLNRTTGGDYVQLNEQINQPTSASALSTTCHVNHHGGVVPENNNEKDALDTNIPVVGPGLGQSEV